MMNFELGNEMWKVSIDQHDPSVSESPTEIEEEPSDDLLIYTAQDSP